MRLPGWFPCWSCLGPLAYALYLTFPDLSLLPSLICSGSTSALGLWVFRASLCQGPHCSLRRERWVAWSPGSWAQGALFLARGFSAGKSGCCSWISAPPETTILSICRGAAVTVGNAFRFSLLLWHGVGYFTPRSRSWLRGVVGPNHT